MYNTMWMCLYLGVLSAVVDDTINRLIHNLFPAFATRERLTPQELRAWIRFHASRVAVSARWTATRKRRAPAVSEHHILADLQRGPAEGDTPDGLAERTG